MKKKVLLMALIIGVLFVFACKKDGKTQTTTDGAFSEPVMVVSNTLVNPGYALRVNTGFYVLDGEDDGEETTLTKWSASIALGERLMTGNVRNMTYKETGRVNEFIEVRRENGSEGYVLTLQAAVGGRLAVVVDDRAFMYRTASLVDVTGTILSRKTVVVYYPESHKDGFVEVKGYDPVRQAYIASNISQIRFNTLSIITADIQSSILLQTAQSLAASQAASKGALLESALLEYPDSVFNAEIFEIANPNTSGVLEAKNDEGGRSE